MTAKERQRAKFLQIAFTLTPAEWETIFSHQRGVCFCCGRPQIGKRLATDHSHEDGLVRGLLCNKCNALLGKIENNFKRYGLHKIPGMTVIQALLRLGAYLTSPPATEALGRQVFGYPGRIGTKEYRKWAKKRSYP